MRLITTLFAGCLLCVAHAHGQRELLGKLVKGDDPSRTPVDNVSVSLDEDGSHDVTKDGGLFHPVSFRLSQTGCRNHDFGDGSGVCHL